MSKEKGLLIQIIPVEHAGDEVESYTHLKIAKSFSGALQLIFDAYVKAYPDNPLPSSRGNEHFIQVILERDVIGKLIEKEIITLNDVIYLSKLANEVAYKVNPPLIDRTVVEELKKRLWKYALSNSLDHTVIISRYNL